MPKITQGAVKSASDQGPARRGTTDPIHGLYLWWLRESLADPRKLLEWHNEARGNSGRPKKELEVFKRAAVILTVTSWETFIENTLKLTFERRLRSASSPKELGSTFITVAKEWVKRENIADNPERLVKMSADGWREVVLEELKNDLDRFHTPNSKGTRRMYQKYLEVDVTARWKWKGMTSQSSCKHLDDLVNLRGKLTHRARSMYEFKAAVRLEDAVGAIKLVERLAHCTLLAL